MGIWAKFKKNWTSFLMLLLAIICLICATCFAYYEKSQSMWCFMIATAFFILLALYKLSYLKLGPTGVEAKMGELLREAETTIEELQELTKTICSTTLSLVKRHNRFSSFTGYEEMKIETSIKSIMEKIKIPSPDIDAVFLEWYKFTYFDYTQFIFDSVKGFDLSPGTINDISKYRSSFQLDDIPSPDEIETFLKKYRLLNDHLYNLIDDYRYYQKYKKHRDENKWNKFIEKTH